MGKEGSWSLLYPVIGGLGTNLLLRFGAMYQRDCQQRPSKSRRRFHSWRQFPEQFTLFGVAPSKTAVAATQQGDKFSFQGREHEKLGDTLYWVVAASVLLR